ncbi:MAG: CoA pyrophosphatase [Eubacteriaceae bacterium]|nr:CoA pyrophosphatase [Eubacteriaceae bacterium]
MGKSNLDKIREIFENRRPGAVGSFKRYSVLIPLAECDGELVILYEKRAGHLDRQPGEVCFPGGRQEPGENSRMCAVRETMEELGLGRDDIQIISRADTLYGVRNELISCYLGSVDISKMAPASAEVEDTFTVPLKFLLENEPEISHKDFKPEENEGLSNEKTAFLEGYNWMDIRYEVPIYTWKGHKIWGLTGRITHDFIKILKGEKK